MQIMRENSSNTMRDLETEIRNFRFVFKSRQPGFKQANESIFTAKLLLVSMSKNIRCCL